MEPALTQIPASSRTTGTWFSIDEMPCIISSRAEPEMKADWIRPARDSALPWPKRCSSSAGASA
ncbi:hypothetical protein D3C84_284170 [compost metagenome]